MNSKSNYGRRAAPWLAAILALAVLNPLQTGNAAQPGATQNVKVVNTTAEAVPTAAQGTTTVGGTVNVGTMPDVNIASMPTVAAAQSGVWMVDVNGIALVRDVDNPARQPFRGKFAMGASPGELFANAAFVVPAGKRLVIEFVSADCGVPTGQKCAFHLLEKVLDVGTGLPTTEVARDFLVASPQGTFAGGVDRIRAAQALRIYLEPEGAIGMVVERTASDGTMVATFGLSGYFVDVP